MSARQEFDLLLHDSCALLELTSELKHGQDGVAAHVDATLNRLLNQVADPGTRAQSACPQQDHLRLGGQVLMSMICVLMRSSFMRASSDMRLVL